MSGTRRELHLGLYASDIPGIHLGAWRRPGAYVGPTNVLLYQAIAHTAERAKFDMLFFADSLNSHPQGSPAHIVKLEPTTVLAALAMTTRHIGLATTASTTYSEPYNLARVFASLDHISGGRAGWNVVTGAQPDAAANFGLDSHPPHEDRYARAAEFLTVVKGLWDGWEDGAVVMDPTSGQYMDMSKRHPIHHKGTYFSVEGPLNVPRPVQGHPVIIQAGASDTGRAFAAAVAEVIYTVHTDAPAAKAFAIEMKAAVEKNGRDPAHFKIMPGLVPIVGTSEKDAKAKLEEVGRYVDPKAAMRGLWRAFGHDLSAYPLDGPLPELPKSGMMQSYAEKLTAWARADNLSIRDLRDHAAASLGHWMLMGTPEMIADQMEEWFALDAADGFNIMPPWCPGALDDFASEVVPLLQKRGLFRTEYSGQTLRDHLGLPRPVNRFAEPRRAHSTGEPGNRRSAV